VRLRRFPQFWSYRRAKVVAVEPLEPGTTSPCLSNPLARQPDIPAVRDRRHDTQSQRSLVPNEMTALAVGVLYGGLSMTNLLLIEDGEASLGESFASPPLADAGWRCDRAIWSSFAYESLGRTGADLIVASGVRARSRLLNFSYWLRHHPAPIPTITVLPEDSGDELVHACFEAADDCVLCPLRPDELRQRIGRILGSNSREAFAIEDRPNSRLGLAQLVGRDKNFLHEIAKIPLAARSDAEVLITGETGTGKELCARRPSAELPPKPPLRQRGLRSTTRHVVRKRDVRS
jgi:DNA-binding response OmpR family regulator